MTPRLKETFYKEIQPALKDKFGFKNVYNIGGFNEWCNSGGEIQAHL